MTYAVLKFAHLLGAILIGAGLIGVWVYRVARDVSVYAVYPAREHLPPKVRVFVDLLAERFGSEPYWEQL